MHLFLQEAFPHPLGQGLANSFSPNVQKVNIFGFTCEPPMISLTQSLLLLLPFKNVQNLLSSGAKYGLWAVVCQGKAHGPCFITFSSHHIVWKRAELNSGRGGPRIFAGLSTGQCSFSKYPVTSTLQFYIPPGKTRSLRKPVMQQFGAQWVSLTGSGSLGFLESNPKLRNKCL